MGATIVWFRLDLRLGDNPALHTAAERGEPIIPLYIWAPEEEGDWPPGAASRWWLHHSLVALDKSLRERGSRLIVRRGPSLETLRQLIQETRADLVVFNRRYEPALVARDRVVSATLPTESFNSALLIEPWDMKPYQVFTPFWKACLQKGFDAVPLPEPRLKTPERWPKSLDLCELELLPKLDWAKGFDWTPGEKGARANLERFTGEGVPSYAEDRNRPDRAGTSRLSPHLHFGEISPRQVWSALPSGAERYRAELGWREFAHHLLHNHPETPLKPLRAQFADFPWETDVGLLKAWQKGETGFELVDAGMKELWATGWMHNRVRMVAASFLVKDLLIPWQEGARWFWDTLVDADLANNTLGWQWTAGCGADAAPFFRVFNPDLQAEKFDPEGVYRRRWVKELAFPIVDHGEARKRALAIYKEL